MATFTDAERDTILAALRLWQVPAILDSVSQERRQMLMDIADENGGLTPAQIDALCERLNCEEPTEPVYLSECCHAEIGYDAWVDSNGALNGGPYDNSICTNCSMEDPEVWDGESPPWPRSEREGGADLPEGVEEPPPEIISIVLHRQKRAKHPVWLADTTMDNGTEEQAPTPYLAGMDAASVAQILLRMHPHARVGVRADDLGATGDKIVWFDRKKLEVAHG